MFHHTNTETTFKNLSIIKQWLLDEYNHFGQGFYVNIDTIENAFRSNRLITFDKDEVPIGFVVWNESEKFIDIDILAIHYKHRKKEYGRIFYKLLENYFLEKDYLAIKLYCNPPESVSFWRKMGCLPFPENINGLPELSFYKPLIKTATQSNNFTLKNKLELWDVEPHLARSTGPKWCWEINSISQKFKEPILHPADSNWNIKLTMNGKTINEDKVKYFSRVNPIDFSPFLFIQNLFES
jgi:hypothetical protein